MSRYSTLPSHLRDALARIEPSHDGELQYYPCRAAIKSGQILDTVYIVPEKPYLKYWGVYPEDDRAQTMDSHRGRDGCGRQPNPPARPLCE